MERIGPAVAETWSKNSAFGLGLGNFGEFERIGDMSFGIDPGRIGDMSGYIARWPP